jgi:2-dehydropantoate 2-reductase
MCLARLEAEMRVIIYGAGAVGGVIGGRLAQHGHDVVLIARGAHAEAIRDEGLTLLAPGERHVLRVPVATTPAEIGFRAGDVVLMAMKTQDSEPALNALREVAGTGIPVVCVQNGVENERRAARRFDSVYAVPVRLPATHLAPGIVAADSANMSGVLDVGCYPEGVDTVAVELSALLAASRFSSVPEPRPMRHKYHKLLMNLGNAIDAACGPGNGARELAGRARAEALACYAAAGIDCASDEEDRQRRADHLQVRPIDGQRRAGGSTFQSLARGKREVEVDYLNGEIVLLGRLHGVPTPVNTALQRIANQMAARGLPPGSMSVAELERLVAAGGLPAE